MVEYLLHGFDFSMHAAHPIRQGFLVEIEQTFEVPFDRALVWRSFGDTVGIVGCLPGAALTAPPNAGRLKLSMTVKLGPIVATFAGDCQMHLDGATHTGSISGSGSDRQSGSRVKGEAAFSLHALDGVTPATRIDVRVDYAMTGNLAQFSRAGIVRELAARLTSSFAENLKKKLETENTAQEDAEVHRPDVAPVATSEHVLIQAAASDRAAIAPLNLNGLFWHLLLDRLKRFFARGQ
jgi:carbon monoxide dehydrogenase subunit G